MDKKPIEIALVIFIFLSIPTFIIPKTGVLDSIDIVLRIDCNKASPTKDYCIAWNSVIKEDFSQNTLQNPDTGLGENIIEIPNFGLGLGLPSDLFDAELCGYLVGKETIPVHVQFNKAMENSRLVIRTQDKKNPDCIRQISSGTTLFGIDEPHIDKFEPNQEIQTKITELTISKAIEHVQSSKNESDDLNSLINNLSYTIVIERKLDYPEYLPLIKIITYVFTLNLIAVFIEIYNFILK